MSSYNWNSLTDSELHRKLIECGLPNVPVTETTRDILLKKLERIMREKKNKFAKNEKQSRLADNELKRKNSDLLYSENCFSNSHARSQEKSHGLRNHSSNIHFDIGNQRNNSSVNVYAPVPVFSSECVNEIQYNNDLNDYFIRTRPGINTNQHSGSQTLNSGVVNRLLRFREQNINNTHAWNTEDSSTISRRNCMPLYNRTIPQQTFWSEIAKKMYFPCTSLKHTLVPFILIGALVLFFVIITAAYLVKTPQMSTIDENNISFTVCKNSEEKQVKKLTRKNCINNELLQNAVEIVKDLNKLLNEKTQHYSCIDNNMSHHVSYKDFYNFLYKIKKYKLSQNLGDYLMAAEYLIMNNPKWKISIIRDDGALEFWNNQRNSNINDISFYLVSPTLPWKCSLMKKVQRYFFIVGILFLLVLIAVIVVSLVRVFLNYKHEREQEITNFTKEIINALVLRSSKCSDSDDNEVVINHLRDEIVPLKNRDKLLWAWNEAVRLLEENDSRIVFSVSVLNGEEYKTMKWHTRAREPDNPFLKQWQSPAFSSANKVINPPTPCLKIRHMFDSSEAKQTNLKAALSKAILLKVGKQCQIEDFQLDLESCCVYIRCKSVKDAGIIHNEINGWWFDNRLISIKFLHLSRYLCRFPELSTNK